MTGTGSNPPLSSYLLLAAARTVAAGARGIA